MKKWLAMMLALLMLLMAAGCESSGWEEDDDDDRRSHREDEEDDGETVTGDGQVRCTIEVEDRSWENDNGDELLSNRYHRVVILEDSPQAERINALIEADMEDFFSYDDFPFESKEELETQLSSFGWEYGSLHYDAVAEVTQNGDGVFSICINTPWFMGGVYNGDYYGLTFDLRTGEQVGMDRLVEMGEDELWEKLRAATLEYVYENYGEGAIGDPAEIFDTYSLETLAFHVADGQIILTFPTYTFAPGAAGATVVPTGIMLGDQA